jgi:ribosomal protein L7Ae-like RNA K-turn-binding protein
MLSPKNEGQDLSELRSKFQNTYIQNLEINDDVYISSLNKLKFAAKCGSVSKGLKETLRAIKSQKAKLVYLAVDCDLPDYKKVIEESCDLFKVKIFEVNDWKEIRDCVMDCVPSGIIFEKARRNGVKAKIKPKCYVAAILRFGDIEKKIQDMIK